MEWGPGVVGSGKRRGKVGVDGSKVKGKDGKPTSLEPGQPRAETGRWGRVGTWGRGNGRRPNFLTEPPGQPPNLNRDLP